MGVIRIINTDLVEQYGTGTGLGRKSSPPPPAARDFSFALQTDYHAADSWFEMADVIIVTAPFHSTNLAPTT
jgi:hypothetical protein